jgi:hypothetical protein
MYDLERCLVYTAYLNFTDLFYKHQALYGVDGRIILGWIFKQWDVGVWTGVSWLRTETGGG